MKKNNLLLIFNGWKATPSIFGSVAAACDAGCKTKAHFKRAYKYVAVHETTLQHYVEDAYGDEHYAAYDVFDGVWYVHERAPYDTACDWCSIGGKFCDYCEQYGEDPYDNCGEAVDFEVFLNWLGNGGGEK